MLQFRHSGPFDNAPKHGSLLRVGYILCYRSPDYIRTQNILEALNSCPEVELHVARNTHKGLRRYVETWLALRRMRAEHKVDIYILGFRGHEIFWPVFKMIRGAPLIFDALMSPYASLREEKKIGALGKLLAPIFFRLERSILRRADLVLTDTQLHLNYFARTFSIPKAKILALPIGAIEKEPFDTSHSAETKDSFSVLFYGSFLPLHGIAVIVAAAAILKDLPIRFDFIGGSTMQSSRLKRECMKRGIYRYTHRTWVPLAKLLQSDIPLADLCLGGPFGGTPQASRVVTGKTMQCIALGKATVIGLIDEDYGFLDRINCLLVQQGNPQALADAIHWAYANRIELDQIGAKARVLYNSSLSVHAIAERLLPHLQQIAAKIKK